jgi:hypothetical protein
MICEGTRVVSDREEVGRRGLRGGQFGKGGGSGLDSVLVGEGFLRGAMAVIGIVECRV